MAKSLVVVESKAKAKTIQKYLGKGYKVEACMGHVRDLPAKSMGVDLEADFKPTYRTIPARRPVVTRLKKAAAAADKVFLAPDPDREGEAIAWHLVGALKLPKSKVFRVTFNEITKQAVQRAFEQPTTIDESKVDAQQARRILDRIVGYQLSPLLWKKVARRLSAGRVQSVAVKLIVEREREIAAFESREYWEITVELSPEEDAEAKFEAELTKVDQAKAEIATEAQAQKIVDRLDGADFIVEAVEQKRQKARPSAPFSTSTMQQAASARLRLSTKRTMRIAQQLYEGLDVGPEGATGLITYMRTDSLRIANEARDACRDFISTEIGPDYLPEKPRAYRSRKGAQEAHEAVRPTDVHRTPEQMKSFLNDEQWKLYDLIWRRFVASQMGDAVYDTTQVTIGAGPATFLAKGRQVVFNGHTKVWTPHKEQEEQLLPALAAGQRLRRWKLTPSQHFTKPPPRYTEASLVRVLEREGIGRPSTYAPIISTIQDRKYVRQMRRRFHATDLGMLVTDRLVEFFPRIMDTEFTSHLEEDLDRIEAEHLDWRVVLRQFYEIFSVNLARAEQEMVKYEGDAGEVCEKCGKKMLIKMSLHGKFVACSGFPDCRNTHPVASAEEGEMTDGHDEELTNEAGEPICEKCGSRMIVRAGRQGPFLSCSDYPKCRNTRTLPDSERQPKPTGEDCPECGKPLVRRIGRRGPFIACSGYPDCRFTKTAGDRPGPVTTNEACEKCGHRMLIRWGSRGAFLACSGFPRCRNVKPLGAEHRALAEEAERKAKGEQGTTP